MSAMSDDEEESGLGGRSSSTIAIPPAVTQATASTLQRTRGAFTFAWNSHGTEAEAQPIPLPFHRMVSETLPDPDLDPVHEPAPESTEEFGPLSDKPKRSQVRAK